MDKRYSFKIIYRWFLVIAWMAIIFYFSAQPNLKTPFDQWDFIVRKLAHFFEYFILAILIYWAVKESFLKLTLVKLLFLIITISFLYAIFDEFHQTFILGRVGSISDVIIDSLGIISFILIILAEKNSKNRKWKSG